MPEALTADQLARMHAYWRAANYLSVGQIYLRDNPLLERPLEVADVKPRLLGHWGTTPGLNLLYVHLNRLIQQHELQMLLVTGPGHGGPGIVAHTYLEGTYSEHYPAITRDRHGLQRLFRQFSWPGGIPSHVAPQTPGSIHEGGELGYSLLHAYGAAFDNPQLIVACVVGDGEAETGALAASWHSNKFINPARDGAVLPILHLNGYKIANPALLARIGDEALMQLLRGYGHEPLLVAGDDPESVHQALAAALDQALAQIQHIQRAARSNAPADAASARSHAPTDAASARSHAPTDASSAASSALPRWPMIVLRTPKGWTGPKLVDGLPTEGHWRSHQVPIANLSTPAHLQALDDWLRSYRPHELFDASGALRPELAALAPSGALRMGASMHSNGGALLQDLHLPDFAQRAVTVSAPGATQAEATRVLGHWLRDVMQHNLSAANFRLFGPDETASNRLDAVYGVTGKTWLAERHPGDTDLSADGRVMEVLSEHLCQGWLEGYLLTGRHGLFSCYESFIPIIDSMLNQHAKWLTVSREVAWRKPLASVNYLLTSHLWRQDHNGFSHQDPGFIDHVVNQSADIARVYFPPDANCLLAVMDECLRSRHCINVVVAGKQPAPQWLDIEAAVQHCRQRAGIWHWAGNCAGYCAGNVDANADPDVVLACAGDVPTLETLAAVMLLREQAPDLRVRVVNVVDLMALQPDTVHPHGLTDAQFDALFTLDKPVIFAFHGHPSLIHRLTYRRHNHASLHVRGFIGQGTTTTPFDMVVLNRLDRHQLALDAIRRVPRLASQADAAIAQHAATIERHKAYICEQGDDLPEILHWRWEPNRRS